VAWLVEAVKKVVEKLVERLVKEAVENEKLNYDLFRLDANHNDPNG
jgi:hypothetical protein